MKSLTKVIAVSLLLFTCFQQTFAQKRLISELTNPKNDSITAQWYIKNPNGNVSQTCLTKLTSFEDMSIGWIIKIEYLERNRHKIFVKDMKKINKFAEIPSYKIEQDTDGFFIIKSDDFYFSETWSEIPRKSDYEKIKNIILSSKRFETKTLNK